MQLEVVRTDVFANSDYFKTKTIFLLTFENLFFYTGFTDCRLLITFVFYLNILIFLVLHLFSDTFFSISIGFQKSWHVSFRNLLYHFISIFMHTTKALVEYMFTSRGHFIVAPRNI